MSEPEPPRRPRDIRKVLWAIALAFLAVSILITLFTPVTFFVLFLPFIFTPFLWPRHRQRGRDGGDEDDGPRH